MTQVLHVEGLSNEVMPFFVVAPGESQADVIRRLGGTFRVEEIPDELLPPRKLSDEAARFIASYQPSEPGPYALAVFWCYHSLEADEFETVEQAERYLDLGEEELRFAGEAVVAPDGTVTVRP